MLFLVGWLAAKVLPGRGSDFMLELPPLRVPQAGNIAVKTLARIEWYLREALPLFVVGTLILYVLDRVRRPRAARARAAPLVVGVLELPKEAAAAFILGFLRRDYAAAGLFLHYEPFMDAGTLTRSMQIEIVVALVTITLFIPCIANFFMILKERGWKTGVAIMAFIVPFAFAVGAAVNRLMRCASTRSAACRPRSSRRIETCPLCGDRVRRGGAGVPPELPDVEGLPRRVLPVVRLQLPAGDRARRRAPPAPRPDEATGGGATP